MGACLQHWRVVINFIMKSAVWSPFTRLPICKINYYLLKLSIINYVSYKRECEIFFFHCSFIYLWHYCQLSLKLRDKFVCDILKITWHIDFKCGSINFHNQGQYPTIYQHLGIASLRRNFVKAVFVKVRLRIKVVPSKMKALQDLFDIQGICWKIYQSWFYKRNSEVTLFRELADGGQQQKLAYCATLLGDALRNTKCLSYQYI